VPGLNHLPHPAIVARGDGSLAPCSYLQLSAGHPHWTDDPDAATAFESMREALRVAVRLPATLRAYGIPRPAEFPTARDLH